MNDARTGRLVAAAISFAIVAASPIAEGQETAFVAESHAAMHKMMRAMEVKPRGDVDADFATMMIAHHIGAIEMAQALLRAGRNEQLRRLAQEIIVTQQQEIDAMRLALDHTTAPAAANQNPATLSLSSSATNEPGVNVGTPVSHRDRVYAAEQFSNTVSVIDPADNRLLGVIRLGDPTPGNLSPLYRGQLLVHGLGVSPDHRTLAVVSIGSNSVTFIDTQTNDVKHVTYVGRSPHEAFFTPDGKEVWVSVRGESYVAVLDGTTYEERTRIEVPNGPGMQIFSPDGQYGYVCSSFTPETVVISVADHRIVGHVPQESPFCPNIASSPDGKQVWFTLKDIGKVTVFDAHPPFAVLRTIETGPITNHVNFAATTRGQFAYVTSGGLNQVLVFRTDDFSKIATIPVGKLPHGVWPSGDGTRVYVGLENADEFAAIDTLTQEVIATIPIGQAPQAVIYVPNAVPEGTGLKNLQPLGVAGQTTHLTLAPPGTAQLKASPTSVSLFDQGLMQMLQASVTGLESKRSYVLALSETPDGMGALEPLATFITNPAGSAIVNTLGPLRQVVQGEGGVGRRYLAIVPGTPEKHGTPTQIQVLK